MKSHREWEIKSMHHNRSALTLLLFLAFPLGITSVFTQTNRIDKSVIARFEKSIELGKIKEVERAMLDVAVSHPNDPRILELLANVRYRQNRISEATALYRRVLVLDPKSASAKVDFARILFTSGNPEESKLILSQVDEVSISSQSLRLNLASVYLLMGDPEKALSAIEKLPLKIKNTAALPLIAAIYLELNDKTKLRELLPLMRKAGLLDPVLAFQSAKVLHSAGMKQEAVSLLRTVLAAAPTNYDILILLGTLETETKQFTSASEHLIQAAKLKIPSAKLFFAQAILEEMQGNPLMAFELLRQARTLSPKSPEILSRFVITAMRANQSRSAIEAAQVLAGLKSDHPEYLYLLGAAYLQNNNLDQAERNLTRLMEIRPADSRGCLALGLTFAAQKDLIEKARQQLSSCAEIDPKNPEVRYHLGLSYKSQGETVNAIKYLEEAINLAPNYALALRDLGALYLQAGFEAKARTVLEKALAIGPKDAEVHFQLSRLYNLIGEGELGKTHLEIFRKLRNPSK